MLESVLESVLELVVEVWSLVLWDWNVTLETHCRQLSLQVAFWWREIQTPQENAMACLS